MKELKDYRHMTWQCFRDSVCKQVFTWHTRKGVENWQNCPSLAYFNFAAYSGQGRFDCARGLIEGEMKWTPKLLEVAYACQLDGHCDYNCGRIMELQPGKCIQAMRADALKQGLTPPGGFKDLLAAMKETMNPYRKPDADRAKWMKDLPADLAAATKGKTAKATPKTSSVLLYVGCGVMRDAAAEQTPKTALKILAKAGVDVGLLGERERCCGNPSLRLGDVDNFVAFAKENIKMFNEMGVKKLVTLCPFCHSTFKRDYPEVGDKMDFEVVHILEFVDQLIKEGKLKPKKANNVELTYHDPCHLGRISGFGLAGCNDFQGIYDAPRNILKAIPGLNYLEMDRCKDNSWCCGAGSWMRNGYLDFARWTADERIKEVKGTGATTLASYCYHCEENLGEAVARDGGKLKMANVLDLLLESL
jgi:Fe-S oxidoreductase